MYLHLALFGILTTSLGVEAAQFVINRASDAYFWRDYYNSIPNDAFFAGLDSKRQNMYIVQVLHDKVLVPGFLNEVDSKVWYEYGNKSWTTTINIKVFCTNHPNQFQWVETNTFDFLIDDNYVVGGYEPDHIIFIGKSTHNGGDLFGKVVVHKADPVLLHIANGNEVIRLNDFQVLTYKPSYSTIADYTTSRIVTAFESGSEFNNDFTNGKYSGKGNTPAPYVKKGESSFDIYRKSKSITLLNDNNCSCSKGTVIINFN